MRASPLLSFILASLLLGALLSACSSNSSGALESQACKDVKASLSHYAASVKATGATRTTDEAKALTLLRAALRPAALASSSSSDYQALAATLSETNRVAEALLVPALTAQCASSG